MKNKLIAFTLMIAVIASLASCAARSKYGCPGNPSTNSRFKG